MSTPDPIPSPRLDWEKTAATDGATCSTTEITAREYASSNSASLSSAVPWPPWTRDRSAETSRKLRVGRVPRCVSVDFIAGVVWGLKSTFSSQGPQLAAELRESIRLASIMQWSDQLFCISSIRTGWPWARYSFLTPRRIATASYLL